MYLDPVGAGKEILGAYANSTVEIEVNTYQSAGSTNGGDQHFGSILQDAKIVQNSRQSFSVLNGKMTNGVGAQTNISGTFNTSCSLYLFALNHVTAGVSNYSSVRYYRAKLYRNNTLAHDLIPCYRKADSKTGFYDIETDTFYPNATSTELTVGWAW